MRPRVVAHRGASGYAPETTLAAFRMALEMNVDFLELDVHLSRDGEVVAIHDPVVDRTTNGRGQVGALDLSELKRLDAGSWFNRSHPRLARAEYAGQKIPTLLEVIQLVKSSRVGLYIEMKDPKFYPGVESRIQSILQSHEFRHRAVVFSFDRRSVEEMKRLDPSIRTAFLVGRTRLNPAQAAVKVHADELAIRHRLLTAHLSRRARKIGLGLTVWTVNRERDMRRMVRLGVDRIITNYPDRLLQILDE